MQRSFNEILTEISEEDDKDKKKQLLKDFAYSGTPAQIFMEYFYNPVKIEAWSINKDVTYTPNPFPGSEGQLWGELRRLYLFIDGLHPGLSQKRRDELFVQLLESIDAKEAAWLHTFVKTRKMPFPGISLQLIRDNIEYAKEWRYTKFANKKETE